MIAMTAMRDNEALRETVRRLSRLLVEFPGDPPTTEFALRILDAVDRHLAPKSAAPPKEPT